MTGKPPVTPTLWGRLARLVREDARRLVTTGVPHLLMALLLTQGMAMIRRILLVRILTLGELGQMTYVTQIADFVALVADLGICTAVLKYAAEPGDEKDKRRLYFTGLFWSGISAAIVAAVYFVAVIMAGLREEQVVRVFLLMVTPYIALSAIVKVPLVFMQSRREIKRAAALTAVTQATSLVLLVGATYLFNLWGFFVAITVAPLTNLALLLLATRRQLQWHPPSWPIFRKLVGFGVPSMFANAAGVANAAVAVVLLRHLTDSDELVGLYSIGLLVMTGARMLPSALMGTAFPYLSGLLHDPERLWERMRELALKQTAVVAAIAAAWLFVGRQATILVFGARFEDSFWTSEVLLAGLIGFASSAPYGQGMLILGRVPLNMSIALLQLFCNVVLGFLFIPRYQILGAAAAVTIAQLIAAGASIPLTRMAFRKHFGLHGH